MNTNTLDIGYCCNVHPGTTLAQVKQNLIEYSVVVRQQVAHEKMLPVGLWLSSKAVEELIEVQRQLEFKDFLSENGLLPFTINGFPFGNFHQDVVKHDVYKPTWAEPTRLEYTLGLARILDNLLPQGRTATISTLPIGWPLNIDHTNQSARLKKFDGVNHEILLRSAKHLRECAGELANLEKESGREVVICIEPEPGCLLDNASDVELFFKMYLLGATDISDDQILRHIGICHDVCHSAVMFEQQSDAIATYKRLGLTIGKVQVSSAIEVNFDQLSPEESDAAFKQLQGFAEPKYLHQTSIRRGDRIDFYEDLNIAISESNDSPTGQWRVHFHVPIFAEQLAELSTTQSEIVNCIQALQKSDMRVQHFEVETYAWNAIPQSLRNDSLADDIAKEVNWFHDLLNDQVP